MFDKWIIGGRVNGVFLLVAGVLREFLKEVAWDEGKEWITEQVVEESSREGAEEELPKLSQVDLMSHGPSSFHLTPGRVSHDSPCSLVCLESIIQT